MSAPGPRVALASRCSLSGSLLRTALLGSGALVVCQSHHPDRFLSMVRAEHPDVVVVEVPSVTESVAALVTDVVDSGAVVLMLCSTMSPENVVAAMAAGVTGFLSLELSLTELAEAIEAVRRRHAPLDPRAAAAILDQWRTMRSTGRATPAARAQLSSRELDVLARMAAGNTTKAVAHALALSVKTVEQHKTRIFGKLGVRSQAEAVNVAISLGVLSTGREDDDAR